MAVNLLPPGDMPAISGVDLACVSAGLRYIGRDDLLLIELVEGTNTSAVFTQNRFSAAPVQIAKRHLAMSSPRAMLVNMGNANAATGPIGTDNCLANCQLVAELLSVDVSAILPFSTGVIGEQFDMARMDAGIKQVVASSGASDWVSAAQAIMTTDTVAKATSREFEIDGQRVTINGISKGAGMMCPNMATMLAFIATDAPIEQDLLEQLLRVGVDASFNRITVDSDTSTNDAVTFSATGQIQMEMLTSMDDPRVQQYYQELESLLIELATDIVRDGEGATKFIKVEVLNGASQSDSRAVAYSVANSPLVKTALFAGDPNWGRLPMAIGKADTEHVSAEQVDIAVNDVLLMRNGMRHCDYTEELGQAAFAAEEITIAINLNAGGEHYHVWTSDLSHEYVSINADYRS